MSSDALRTLWSGMLAVSLPACAASRVESNPEHCANHDGDAYCARTFPERPLCTKGVGACALGGWSGCVDEVADECRDPCGSQGGVFCEGLNLSSSGTGTTPLPTPSGDDTAATGEPTPCAAADDCPSAAAPLCDPASGACVSCDALADGDAGCRALDESRPLCVAAECVQCTAAMPAACEGMTPICDEASHRCVPCSAHEQCGEAACNLFTGACLPADAVVHVGGRAPDFATLVEAVQSTSAGAEVTMVVHEGGSYDEIVVVDDERVLGIFAADGERPRWIQSGGSAPQLTIASGTVLMEGIQLSGNASEPGILVDGGQAWIDRSWVVDNNGGAIAARDGAWLVSRNCFVGGDVNDVDALDVSGSTAEILYTTVGAGFGEASALTCDGAAAVTVRNSVLVARGSDPELQCAADVDFTALEMTIGGTNTGVGDMSVSWFQSFGSGDFHLAISPGEIASAAQWEQDDPAVDIDGQPRPQVDESADAAGADVP